MGQKNIFCRYILRIITKQASKVPFHLLYSIITSLVKCLEVFKTIILKVELNPKNLEIFLLENVTHYIIIIMLWLILSTVDINFVQMLQLRFKRCSNNEDTLCDIYDGKVYKKNSIFFDHRYNLSFTMNFDGAPKFKSSSMQVWPVQLIINELPIIARYSHIVNF